MNNHERMEPKALAIPKEGYFEKQDGIYGPIFPKTPANYGFTIIAGVKPGRAEIIRAHGKTIEDAIKGAPDFLAPLKLHYLRWNLFDISRTNGLESRRCIQDHLDFLAPQFPDTEQILSMPCCKFRIGPGRSCG